MCNSLLRSDTGFPLAPVYTACVSSFTTRIIVHCIHVVLLMLCYYYVFNKRDFCQVFQAVLEVQEGLNVILVVHDLLYSLDIHCSL